MEKANDSQPRGWYLAPLTYVSSSSPRLASGSIHPFFHPLTHTLIHPPKHPSIHAFVCLPILPYIPPGLTHPSIQYALTSIQPLVHPFIQPHILSSVHPSNHIFFQRPSHTTSHPSFLSFSHLFVNPHPSIHDSLLHPSTYISVHTCIDPSFNHLSSTYPSSFYLSLLSCFHVYSYLCKR